MPYRGGTRQPFHRTGVGVDLAWDREGRTGGWNGCRAYGQEGTEAAQA
ncbi:hypothetical protein RKD41_002164 [Streptomyces tendae]|jgi:hypothetical protein